MLQKGTKPWVAKPAEKVTACCSAIPTSKALSGIAFIIIFSEQPDGIAGVIPTILLFASANSTMVCPKTSWYFGGCGLSIIGFLISPVILSNKPGACHLVWSFSANAKPLPLTVTQCNSLGPGIADRSLMIAAKRFTS
ncbi:hypothetical protein D3C85_898660 [compost metagenome]